MPRRSTPVYLEQGSKRTFACAVDWPGWSRSGKGDDDALETLAAYAPRYACVAGRAGLRLPASTVADLEVVETIPGDATTDFGAPHGVAGVDRAALSAAGLRRMVALLTAAWDELDAVAADAPAELRKGPRGGGRDRDAVVAHVVDAERSYARKIGVRLDAREWRAGGVELMRERIREALLKPAPAAGEAARTWPPRYLARRTAWHALDHAWEIQDRSG